jgi:hypothetical protein
MTYNELTLIQAIRDLLADLNNDISYESAALALHAISKVSGKKRIELEREFNLTLGEF